MSDEQQSHPIPLYGVAIHSVIAGGNLSEMKKVAAEAKGYAGTHPDIAPALKSLEDAIFHLEGGKPVFRPLYGRPIADAIVSGDLGKMKAMAAEAEQHVKSYGDVSSALESLKIEIAKLEAKS